MVKSIKVILYPFDLLTSAGSRVILQLIKFVWIFTAVCYFSPHNDFKKAIVWLFASAFVFEQSRPDDSAAAIIHFFSLQEQCKHYERDLYERKTGAAAVGIHALPNVISMLVNSLYNIVDSLFVARISEDAMTALSLVFPIQNFANAIAIGFGIGINA